MIILRIHEQETFMSDQSLQSRHEELQKQVDAEEKRRRPDPVALTALKKEKLAIKDQMAHH